MTASDWFWRDFNRERPGERFRREQTSMLTASTDELPPEKPLMLAQFGPSLRPDHEAEAERQKALEELRARFRPS